MSSVWPLYHKGLIDGVLQRWLSFWKVLHLHRGNLELCQSDHRVLGHLHEQGPSPPIAQFGRVASSRKSLGGSKLLPFKSGGHCVLGDLQCCRRFLEPFPRYVPQSCLGALRTIPSTSWFGFCSDIHCQLWDLIDRCVPFQIIKDDQWKQDAPKLNFESHSKGSFWGFKMWKKGMGLNTF